MKAARQEHQLYTDPMSHAASASHYKWWVVFMLWWICFFNYADRQAIFSIFPKLKAEFGFDTTQLGVIGSAFMWVYAFGGPLAGFIGDRVRRKSLILGGCLLWSFITITTGWCTDFIQFVSIRALEGLGETFYFPASMSLISDYHSTRTRSRALSFHQSSVYIGTIAGSWLAAWFAQKYGWRMGFFFFGVSGMVLAALLISFLREPRRGLSEIAISETNSLELTPAQPLSMRETARVVFDSPTVICLMVAFMGANFVATIFLTWTPTLLFEKFKFELTSAGLSGSLFIHLASAVGAPLGGLLADRLVRSIRSGRMLVQLFGLLVGAVFVFFIGTTTHVGFLFFTMSCFGICKGLYDSNIFASLYDSIEPRARSSAAGVMNTLGWGGGALGPVFVGWIAQHGRHASEIENMSEAVASCAGVYLVAAAFVLAAIWFFRPTVSAR
jgi:MFS family permease